MTHVELIEKILADFKNFREGVKFAYQYLLTVLKNGGMDL